MPFSPTEEAAPAARPLKRALRPYGSQEDDNTLDGPCVDVDTPSFQEDGGFDFDADPRALELMLQYVDKTKDELEEAIQNRSLPVGLAGSAFYKILDQCETFLIVMVVVADSILKDHGCVGRRLDPLGFQASSLLYVSGVNAIHCGLHVIKSTAEFRVETQPCCCLYERWGHS